MRILTKQGFSLMELMVVIAIIGIMAGIAVPAFMQWLPNMRLKAAARDLHSAMQAAKVEAVKRNTNVVVVLTAVTCPSQPPVPSPGGGYQVFVDNGQGGGVAGDSIRNGAEPVLRSVNMPSRTALCGETFGGVTGFTPRGLLIGNNIGSATLVNDTGRTYTLTLTIAGGIQLQ